MKNRGNMKAWAFAAALVAGALTAPAASADPLRVCADPDNLPFTKNEGSERGVYIELAELVGRQLKVPVEYVWYYTNNERRALRNTIAQNACDAVFALPADPNYKTRGLVRTQAFLQVGYAAVAAPGLVFKSFDDLRDKRIAVQYGSTPQVLLAGIDGLRTTTYRSAAEVFEALAKGEVDVGFLWGPEAGYQNKKLHANRWHVTPLSGQSLDGGVAVAVRRGQDQLLADLDKALVALQPEIAALADKYGFPRETPVKIAAAKPRASSVAAVPPALWATVSDTDATPKAKKTADKTRIAPKPAAEAAPAAPVLSEAAQAGRVQFNDRCSHCHGTDGYSPVRERDVRYLKTRYSDKWQETAVTTIKNGRPDAGMPIWKDILKETDVQQIVSFLVTVQK